MNAERPSRTRARPWLVAAAIILVPLAVLTALHFSAYLIGHVLNPVTPPPPTELFAGLPSDYETGEKIITARLERRFPLGTPARDLETYLLTQGLHSSPAAVPGERNVMAIWGHKFCGQRLDVSWATDQSARLASLRVVYWSSGCL